MTYIRKKYTAYLCTIYIKVTITGSASGSGITSGVKYYSDNAKGTLTVVTTVPDKASGKQIDKTTVRSETKASETGEEAGKNAAVIPFHNEYKASGNLNSEGKASIEASKILTGRDMKSGEFKFHITNDMDTSEKKTIIASGGSFEILQMKTGDSFNIAAVAAILIIALAAMITLVFVRRRK